MALHMGEMSANYLVDWLSVSYSLEQAATLWPTLGVGLKELIFHAKEIAQIHDEYLPVSPRYGYRYVVQSEIGAAVHYTSPDSPQGVHVSYSGTAINTADALTMIEHHLAQGAKVTRLDLAADLRGADIPLDHMFDMMQNRRGKTKGPKAVTRARRFTMMSGSTGNTLYIGSRTSTRMLRIYDKRAQTGSDGGAWWRAEVELKGAPAHAAAKIVLKRGVVALRGILKSVAHFPGVPEWEYLTDYADVIMVRSDQKLRDTRGWLLSHVAKTVAKQCAREENFLYDFITAVTENIPEGCPGA